MGLTILQARAQHTTSCLDWHDVCGAQCCKLVVLPLRKEQNPRDIVRGMTYSFGLSDLSEDEQLYYSLHGWKITGICKAGEKTPFRWILAMKLDQFKISGQRLFIIRRCDWLTEDLKCKEHNTGLKPTICKQFDASFVRREFANQQRGIFIPKKCLYTLQVEADQRGEEVNDANKKGG